MPESILPPKTPAQKIHEIADGLLEPGSSPESMRANGCDEEMMTLREHLDLPVFSRQ
jgi:hypothetical protein